MLVLNKDIHEYDRKEKHIKQKLHNVKDCIKRIVYVIDAKLFESTYKEEWEQTNIQNDQLSLKVGRLQKEIIKLNTRIEELEKSVKKRGKK